MNRTALALLTALLPLTAQAQDPERFFFYERELKTGFCGNRLTGHGLSVAERELEQVRQRASRRLRREIHRSGGVVLTETFFKHGIGPEDKLVGTGSGLLIRDGKHELFRRSGELALLYRAGEAILEGSREVDPRCTVEVKVQGRDREQGRRLKTVPSSVRVSLPELYRLRKAPAGVAPTYLGAVLRQAWRDVLGERPDDVKRYAAELEVIPWDLRDTGGDSIWHKEGQLLTSRQADLVLGRRRTAGRWFRDLLGRSQPLPEVEEDTARQLGHALYRASRGSLEDWEGITALRRSSPPSGSGEPFQLESPRGGAAGRLSGE